MKHALLTWLGLAWLLASPGTAQNHAHGTLFGRADGPDVKLALEIRIDDGWHLYHGPTAKDMSPDGAVGRPTVVEVKGDGVQIGPWHYPEPETVEQENFDDKASPNHIRQHEGTIVLYARGRLASPATLGSLSVDVTGLTCVDAGQCVPYEESLKVEGPGRDAIFQAFPPDLTASASAPMTTGPSNVAPPLSPKSTGKGTDASLWIFLLSAVGWGLFTLLMPCTYPMIPITISYFTKQARQREAGTLSLSFVYGAGIVLVFVLIGVAVGQLIIPFATHPLTNLVIGAFFILFALSLFGVVDLQPPSFLLNVAGQASSKGGYLGVFLMGATLVVTSFTCTAPFVGSLLSSGASSGNLGRVALGMGVFGLTMAIPFVFLSMVPQKVKALPKSGEWMHTLKVTLGFVEIAAALKFVSNVDLVWQWGFLSRELFLFLWMGIFLVAGLYLFGLIRLQGEGAHEISPGRMVAGLFFSLFALYCAYGGIGNDMDWIMTSFIPNYSSRSSVAGGKSAAVEGHTIVKDDYARALALAREQGKLLLVNFTGIT